MNEYQVKITITLDAGGLNSLTGTATISGALESYPKSLLEDVADIGTVISRRLYRSLEGIVKEVDGFEECVMSMESELFDNLDAALTGVASRTLDDLTIKVEIYKFLEADRK